MSSPTRAMLLRFGVTLAVFVLGTYGFYSAYAATSGAGLRHLPDDMFKALLLMTGSFPADLAERPIPWVLTFARIGMPLATVWTAAEVILRKARNPLATRLTLMRGGHLIVAADEAMAAPLVKAERGQRRPVMVWTDASKESWVEDAEARGASWVGRDGPNRGAGRLGLDKARCLLVAGPSDAENIALASAAIDLAARVRQPGPPLSVIARVDNPDLRAPLERSFDHEAARRLTRLRFASLPDIAARRLFLERPVDRFRRGATGAPVVYLLGFSAIAERFAQRLLTGVHPRGGDKPLLVALSARHEHDEQVFFARWPGARALGRIVFAAAPVDQPALLRSALGQVAADHGAPTAVVVDPGGPELNLAAALAALEALGADGQIAPPIYVHGGRDAAAAVEDRALAVFGGPETVCDPEALLQERLDAFARSIHEFYFDGRLAEGDAVGSRLSMQEWDLLPEAVRDDNRLVADCYELRLRDVGARALAGAAEQTLQFTPTELEELSRAEHDRWLAAKLLDGWSAGAVRDDARKIHPDIVGYDALSEQRKDLDREQIRVIGRLLARAGRKGVRDVVVALDGPSGLAEGAPAALEGFARSHPDRIVVALGDFGSADSRAALIAAAGAGTPVQLILPRDASAILAGLGSADRRAAAGLLRDADRLYALPEAEWPPDRRRGFMLARADARIATSGGPADDLPTASLSGTQVTAAPWL